RTSSQPPPRSQPSKKAPPPPQKPLRQNESGYSHSNIGNYSISNTSTISSGSTNSSSHTRLNTPHDSLRSNHSDNAYNLTSQSSSPKSSRSHPNHDSSDYPSNRSTFKGVFSNIVNSVSDLLSSDKKIEISSPYNPVHLTHVGYNLDTGEFTGLPKEWQQLLQESGISKQDQAAHPQAVIDIIGFYTDSQGGKQNDVWKKFEHTTEVAKTPKSPVPSEQYLPPKEPHKSHDRPAPAAPRPVFESPREPPNLPPAKKPPITRPPEMVPGDKQEYFEKTNTDIRSVSPAPPPPKVPPPKPKKLPHQHQITPVTPPPKPSHS
ncbi:signal transducing kinase of the PAK, partial [Modicella reniformis]